MSQTKFNFPSVYNPATQSQEEIIANFVVRTQEFAELFDAIKEDKMEKPPQHFIIQGQRGYGKTTLLLRLKYEIQGDENLNGWLIPVMFDEEQYSVRILAKLWEEIIDVLESEDSSFDGLTAKADELYDSESPEEEIFNLLINALKEKNKKIVLLLDNFGDMIEKFKKKENQRLREIFTTCNHIKLIGASSRILEFYYDYKQPFFEFFKVITLDELNKEETILLLKKLGETYKSEEINKIIDEQPGRIEALRRITGGIPRTVVLLFQIFVDDVNGNSFKDLEFVLDQVTPLYKQRLDSLTPPQQAIIDAVAQNWDAVSTKEISKKVRMPSKDVSAQLNLLEKNQLIRKIPTSTKNHLYQINERFFNIYYLMRLGRRKNRNKILWLVKFFEIMCGEKELATRAQKHIVGLREGKVYEKHAFYVTQALAKTHLPHDLQHELIEETKKYLATKKSELCGELDKSHKEVLEEVKYDILNAKYDLAKKKLKGDNYSPREISFAMAEILREEKRDFETAIMYYNESIRLGSVVSMFNTALLYEVEFSDYDNAKSYYLKAIEKNYAGAMNNLALLYISVYKNYESAKKYLLMAIDRGNANAIFNLALLYETNYGNHAEAKKYYLMAIEKGHVSAMNNLASLFNEDEDYESAKQYYLMAVENKSVDAMNNLASLHFNLLEDKLQALKLQKRAYETLPNDTIIVYGYIQVLLWNDFVEEAIIICNSFFESQTKQNSIDKYIYSLLLMFLAKKQYHFVYNLFKENKFDIIDKYKPVYYAVVKLLGADYDDEFKKMPPELGETVNDLLEKIEQWAIDYS